MMRDLYDASLILRGELTGLDDSGEHQLLDFKGFAGEAFTKVARAGVHGFSSSAPAGSVGYAARIGSSDRLLALGFETPGRPRDTIAGGAVLYDQAGNIVYAKMSGGVEIKAAAGSVEITRGALKVIVSDTRVDLGGPGGFAVETVAGPSSKVFAIL
jgi:phage gp45-like